MKNIFLEYGKLKGQSIHLCQFTSHDVIRVISAWACNIQYTFTTESLNYILMKDARKDLSAFSTLSDYLKNLILTSPPTLWKGDTAHGSTLNNRISCHMERK